MLDDEGLKKLIEIQRRYAKLDRMASHVEACMQQLSDEIEKLLALIRSMRPPKNGKP